MSCEQALQLFVSFGHYQVHYADYKSVISHESSITFCPLLALFHSHQRTQSNSLSLNDLARFIVSRSLLAALVLCAVSIDL